MMRIDLHTHTSDHSNCAISTEAELIEAAIAAGLDGMVLTDHNYQRDKACLDALNEKYAPFKIFAGVEINVSDACEDVLVIGVHDMAAHNYRRWTYPELYAYAQERGGFVAIPHAFRYNDCVNCDVVNFVPDAFELKSKNIDPTRAHLIQGLADELGVKTIVASDAHRTLNVGMHHLVLDNDVYTEADLVRELKAGRFAFGELK